MLNAVGAAHEELETPVVLIDDERLGANIVGMARRVDGKARLSPHIKTHKCRAIAARQLKAGAGGITAAKSQEAVAMLMPGLERLTLAHPLIDPAKVRRVVTVGQRNGTAVRLVADSAEGVAALAEGVAAAGATAEVMVKVDVGLHRCGVAPRADAVAPLAAAIAKQPGLSFAGLIAHAGHAYRCQGAEAVREAARAERLLLGEIRNGLGKAGIDVPEISVGSTPTLLAHDGFDGIDEVRPGNYVFLDLTQVGIGVAEIDDIALGVLATVVSRNDRHAITDAGSKVLSSDKGPHGSQSVAGHGQAFAIDFQTGRIDRAPMTVTQLSEEHGFLAHEGRDLSPGSRVVILPNHACVVANLARRMALIDAAGAVADWLEPDAARLTQ